MYKSRELQSYTELNWRTTGHCNFLGEILQTELTNLSISRSSPATDDHVQHDSDLEDSELHLPQPVLASPSIPTILKSKIEVKTSQKLTISDMTPVKVLKVVVEHIVRSEEVASPSLMSFRLRVFSGRIPRPNNESDYDTWRTNVKLILTDPAVNDLQRSRKVIDSLLPATDLVKNLSPHASLATYLELLDSAYGTVEDGDELFAKFMSTLQNAGEKPSVYLHRLQVVISVAVKRGGVPAEESDRHLPKQFC